MGSPIRGLCTLQTEIVLARTRVAAVEMDRDERTQEMSGGTSLVVQWFRTCLPMQGTRVQALVQEDPT